MNTKLSEPNFKSLVLQTLNNYLFSNVQKIRSTFEYGFRFQNSQKVSFLMRKTFCLRDFKGEKHQKLEIFD
ncbi:MAG: hypothetical protein AAF849_23370, partial [Bacteroidota bacterium]